MQMRRTDGRAAQYLGIGTNKDSWHLKTGLCRSTVAGGGGGSVENKKISANSPVNFRCNGEELVFFKNIVKYCI